MLLWLIDNLLDIIAARLRSEAYTEYVEMDRQYSADLARIREELTTTKAAAAAAEERCEEHRRLMLLGLLFPP